MDVLHLSRMHSPEIRAAISRGVRTVVVPIGSTEQHGPHLPLGMDTIVTEALARRVALHFAPAFVGPTLQVGASDHHLAFTGTVSLSQATLISILLDYLQSLNRHGFERALLLSYHGGNFVPMARAVEDYGQLNLPMRAAAFTDPHALIRAGEEAAEKLGVSPEAAGAHAGHVETSLALYLVPNLVTAQREKGFMGRYHEVSALLFEKGLQALTTNGILGDPTGASAEAGARYLDAVFHVAIEHLERQLGCLHAA